ncbi:MAG: YbaB/EbfC family nucleoid-associated protein [Kibdelosporangium sp.]
MASDHRAQVEELLADYRRSREQLADMQKSLAAISESVTSADGLVTARVSAQGTLTDLAIGDDAYIRYRPAELGKVVVRMVALATAKASEAANRTVSPLLPVRTDPGALLAGTADLTPAELAPAPDVVDDDSFEERSWLDGRRS